MFCAAIFDMDGLLLDSERAIMNAWIGAAKSVGIPISEPEYTPVIGQGSRHADAYLTRLLGGNAAFVQAREAVRATLACGPAFAPKPGALTTLTSLAAMGIPCAVASSTAVAEVNRRLSSADMVHFFASIAGGDEVEAGKPDPAVYLLAAKRLGVLPGQCLAFEDSSNGVRAARAAGMHVVIVPDLVTPDAEGAFKTLSSLEQVGTHAGDWFKRPADIAATS